jgi:hypothetical protein
MHNILKDAPDLRHAEVVAGGPRRRKAGHPCPLQVKSDIEGMSACGAKLTVGEGPGSAKVASND